MLYVTCGHPKGIGLEIFLKSFLLLSTEEKKQVTLIVNRKTLDTYLKDCALNPLLFKQMQTQFVDDSSTPDSTTTLLLALKIINSNDILITLPTSKDQLLYNQKQCAGYTEFFREYFNDQNISMVFKSYDENVLLITDHVPLIKVPNTITNNLINLKISTTLEGFKTYFKPIEEIIISGINPHAGENGILGNEEKLIQLENFKDTKLIGPVPGDTLHIYKNQNINQLFVYMFHDQALSSFKARNLFTGLNMTFGLPFLRLSVDHGTAFNLYGKNKASLTGMMYLLKTALEVHNHGN